MIIGVPKETYPGESRVAIVPKIAAKLVKADIEVLVEQGAGLMSGFSDSSFEEQGARIIQNRADLFASSEIILQVRGLGLNIENGQTDLDLSHPNQIFLGMLNPLNQPETIQNLSDRNITAFALELIPRISRAQSMDILTAMATISGYKSSLLAAAALPKMFPLMMTATGTITPAQVFVIGAGVAGLQAIATTRRLGAIVKGYDVRSTVKDQIESLGAQFIELDLPQENAEAEDGYAKSMDESFYQRQQKTMTKVISDSDVIITTAAIPGKKAPILITTEMIETMRQGSLVVDLAADSGGNCELTEPGKTIIVNGVTIMGPLNLPSSVPHHASQMYANAISSFLLNLVRNGKVEINLEDEIIHNTLVTNNGQIINSKVRELLGKDPLTITTDERGDP